MSHNLINLGTAQLDANTRALVVQGKGAPVSEDGTAPDYGLIPVISQLGLTAMPWPANDEGSAEGLVAEDVPGMNGAIVGARDVRCADVVGKLGPGDVCLHSCGPQHKAQIQLKETKRQVGIFTEDKNGETQMILLDGSGDGKLQIAVGGCMIQMHKGLITLTAGDGTTFTIGDGQCRTPNKLTCGTPTPGFAVLVGPQTGSPGGPASVPLVPAMGFSVG